MIGGSMIRVPLLVVLCSVTYAESWAAQPTTAAASAKEYEVIGVKSIFRRVRRIPEPVRPPDDEQTAKPLEAGYSLRGVVFEGDSFRAFVEHPGGGVIQLSVGDPIAHGAVVEIQLDGVRYQKSGSDTSIWVGLGRNLMGSVTNLMETRR